MEQWHEEEGRKGNGETMKGGGRGAMYMTF